jgi:hypothetical protein
MRLGFQGRGEKVSRSSGEPAIGSRCGGMLASCETGSADDPSLD